jgi:hypothetical protein
MKIWTWITQDYADEEVQVESFALKFKDERVHLSSSFSPQTLRR